ncbi:MAG: protease family protein [Frankiales bacterium]|nr:protease family protein [Frankiales bacterium]
MTRNWRTLWLVIPAAILAGLGALVGLAGTTDDTAVVAGRVFAGVLAVVLAVMALRMFVVGLAFDGARVHVRGIWKSHRVPSDQVAGVVMESSAGGRWLMPSVVTTDGRILRARWAGRPSGRASATQTAGDIAWTLQSAGANSGGLRALLDEQGVEVAGTAARVQQYRSPPNWPAPPVGWQPAPGWNPAPDWPAAPPDWGFWEPVDVPVVVSREIAPDRTPVPEQVPAHLDMRYSLDREIAASLPGTNWGLGEVLKTIGWIVVFFVLVGLIDWLVDSPTLYVALGEGVLGVAVLFGAHKAAKQSGGWRRALGWELPRRHDLWLGLRWFGWQLLATLVAALVLYLITLPLSGKRESNVDISTNDSVISLLVIVAVTVVMAPVVEEFLFRGLLLRALMRRFSFWPSAIIDALIFGLAHAPQASTWAGRIQLAGQISTFGFVQCLLVRRTARLGPAMVVHGMQNALAVGVALSGAVLLAA